MLGSGGFRRVGDVRCCQAVRAQVPSPVMALSVVAGKQKGKHSSSKSSRQPRQLLPKQGLGNGSHHTANGSRPHLNGDVQFLKDYAEIQYLTGRANLVTKHFESAMGVDDFIQRLEIALWAYGIQSSNSIAMVNLCRDEICHTLKHKLDQVFGSSFSTCGLGGVLTCGVSGVAAGLSHSPVSRSSGKERYVFFSFPHISIDARGNVGAISRPGRSSASCACGALNKALVDIRTEGLAPNCKQPGVHEPLDIGDVAERTITDDLEFLIARTVDKRKADYAVVTGIQVHNYGVEFDDEAPNLEFVAPSTVYVVVNGEKTYLDLTTMPSLTPRQLQLLASAGHGAHDVHGAHAHEDAVCNSAGRSTVREIDPPYMYNSRQSRRRTKERLASFAALLAEEPLQAEVSLPWPSWQSSLRAVRPPHRHEDDSSAEAFEQSYWTDSDDELHEAWSKFTALPTSRVSSNGNGSGKSNGHKVGHASSHRASHTNGHKAGHAGSHRASSHRAGTSPNGRKKVGRK